MRYRATIKRLRTALENREQPVVMKIVEIVTGANGYWCFRVWWKMQQGIGDAALNILLIRIARKAQKAREVEEKDVEVEEKDVNELQCEYCDETIYYSHKKFGNMKWREVTCGCCGKQQEVFDREITAIWTD